MAVFTVIALLLALLLPCSAQVVGLSLREKFPQPDLTVVFSDKKFLQFTLNSRASFEAHAKAVQYLVVGADEETVQKCTDAGIETILYSDIIGDDDTHAAEESSSTSDLGKLRCARMDVVTTLQQMGYNILLLDADVVITEDFSMQYFSDLDADFVSGHGTFPREAYEANGFALQSGFYYAKNTASGMRLLDDAAMMCKELQDGQVALNTALLGNYHLQASTKPQDELGTITMNAQASNGPKYDLRIAVLGKRFFPSGCKFIANSSSAAWIRHPKCIPRASVSEEQRAIMKQESLELMGAWYLQDAKKSGEDGTRHKAVLWSFPGSGNTMLRYTFEKITGKAGSTNAIYTDLRLSPVLPGEGRNDGILVKVHPAQDITNPTIIERKAAALAYGNKRIILMRNPYDAIWSWYQLVQTGSHTGRINKRDFNPKHFEDAALRWAELFHRAVDDEYIPYLEDQPDRTIVIKFEDLVRKQHVTLSNMLSFLGEEAEDNELKIHDHPIIKRDEATFDTVPKATAYASQGIVDAMWDIFGLSADKFGYSKPSAPVLAPWRRSQMNKVHSTHKYLTYSPSGGLTNQLITLESAVRFARKSRRTLLLPPLLAEPVTIFPEIWKNDSEKRLCSNETEKAMSCGPNFSEVKTYEWDRVIDLKALSARVSIVTSLPKEEVDVLSKLSLVQFHKCNTAWVLNALREDEGCLPGHIPQFAPKPNQASGQRRSLDCVFKFTRQVDVLHLGSIFGTFHEGDKLPLPRLQFTPEIHKAANEVLRDIRQISDAGYLCVHLRMAGSKWEGRSPFELGRNDSLALARSFLDKNDASLPIYIATDNEDLVRNSDVGICGGKRRCLFASDFNYVTQAHGLEHFQELIPVEYLTCANANDMLATNKVSSFGKLISNMHASIQKTTVASTMPALTPIASVGSPVALRRTTTAIKKKKNYAYVTLLGLSPDRSQRSIYTVATRALVRSLKQTTTSADIVVMMPQGHTDPKVRAQLEEDGAIVMETEGIALPSAKLGGGANVNFDPWFGELVLEKLSALKLTQYDRIQFLDADVVLLQDFSLDHLFGYAPDTPLVIEGLGSESPIRAGWFMVKPSEKAFRGLEAILRRGIFSIEEGWDRLGLPVDYPGWQGDESKRTDKWRFYGAPLEQGLLFHYYYALPKSKATETDNGMLLTVLGDKTMHAMGIVHCYGKLKPWNKDLDLGGVGQIYSVARRRWDRVMLGISDSQNSRMLKRGTMRKAPKKSTESKKGKHQQRTKNKKGKLSKKAKKDDSSPHDFSEYDYSSSSDDFAEYDYSSSSDDFAEYDYSSSSDDLGEYDHSGSSSTNNSIRRMKKKDKKSKLKAKQDEGSHHDFEEYDYSSSSYDFAEYDYSSSSDDFGEYEYSSRSGDFAEYDYSSSSNDFGEYDYSSSGDFGEYDYSSSSD